MFRKCLLQSLNINRKQFYQKFHQHSRAKPRSGIDIVKTVLESRQIYSSQDWKSLRQEFLNNDIYKRHLTTVNIDAVTLTACTSLKKYKLASSYVGFLEEEGIEPNLATLGRILKFLVAKRWDDELVPSENAQIIEIYKKIRNAYPVLDALTLDSLIQALAVTNEWEKCLDLYNELKIVAPVSGLAFSSIVAGAFLNNNEKLAWNLMNEMLEGHKMPSKEVYFAFFLSIQNQKEFLKKAEKMFAFLEENYLKIDEEVARKIIELARNFNIPAVISTIHKGVCQTCQGRLKNFELSDKEFSLLKNKIFNDIIIGRDVFSKTTPEEVKNFQNFIKIMPNYDVVVDGLNVAFTTSSKTPFVKSLILKSVVSHFVQQNRKVLVLGRKHMNRWPKQHWSYVVQNSTVFLTQDISQDDPYLLYCALNSGKNTTVISRDLMRSHKFLLKNFHLRVIFDKWLKQRRWEFLRIDHTGQAVFLEPLPFLDSAQKIGNFWHIPIEGNNNFLCFLKQ